MTLDRRQKILAVLIFAVFVYIVWQMSNFFESKNPNQNISQSVLLSSSRESKVSTIVEVTPEQLEYLKLANRYNLLRLKRLLLEEEAAIFSAKQRIAQSSSVLESMGEDGEWEALDEHEQSHPSKRDISDYKLVHLDHKDDHWKALLNQDGHFFEVRPGVYLKNGDRIVNIDKEGVVLNRENGLFHLTFDGAERILERSFEKKLFQKQAGLSSFLVKPGVKVRVPFCSPTVSLKRKNSLSEDLFFEGWRSKYSQILEKRLKGLFDSLRLAVKNNALEGQNEKTSLVTAVTKKASGEGLPVPDKLSYTRNRLFLR